MSIKKAKDATIRYGNVNVSDKDFSSNAVRRRISIMVPEDILARLRQMASEEETGYQTLINRILHDATAAENSVIARLARIEKAVTRTRH